jgi:predicted AlkP superfamily phosphohydrolase/phosphomutase
MARRIPPPGTPRTAPRVKTGQNTPGHTRRNAETRRRETKLGDRLLIVGWDGADWEIVDDLMARGDLPVLAAAIESGARGDLESTLPSHSWAAWPTFLTGVHPTGHGVFDFVERDPKDPERRVPISSGAIRARTFLEVLSDAGHEVRAANIPVTFPPIPVRGRLIAGAAVPPRSTFVHPPVWQAELERVAPFPLNGLEWARHANHREELIDEALDLIERRTASYEVLLEGEWSVAACVYLATDRLQHPFGAHLLPSHPDHARLSSSPLRDRLRAVYRSLDRQLGRLRTAAGEDATFVLMSDHGFRPVTRTADINRMLEAVGFAHTRATGGAIRALRRSRFARAVRSAPVGAAIRAKVRPPSAVDWRRTAAYQFGTGGCVSLNVRGREPHGVVESDEYRAVRDEVAQALLAFEDPETGEHPVEGVMVREDLPDGPYRERAPDLLLRATPLWMFAPAHAVTASTTWPSATHRRTGIIVASGGRALPGSLGVHSLADIAPTVLAFHGIDPGGAVDGRVIEEIAGTRSEPPAPALDRAGPVDDRGRMDRQDEEFVEQHLRDLGYID